MKIRLQKLKKANENTVKALEIYELIYDQFNENIPRLCHNLARICFEREEYVKSWNYY